MRLRQILVGAACLAAAVTFARCGSDSATPPTTPTPVPNPVPTTAPTPTPKPGIVLPAGMVCDPTPPPLLYFKAGKWRPHGSSGWVLDSEPIVKNVNHYCAQVGLGDWRYCQTRPEGDPQRVACDYLMTGTAKDTGRWGPTWTVDDMPCDGQHQCANNPDNQFKATAKDSGLFKACASELVPVYDGEDEQGGRCGEVWVEVP
jgi:hypothetical protein